MQEVLNTTVTHIMLCITEREPGTGDATHAAFVVSAASYIKSVSAALPSASSLPAITDADVLCYSLRSFQQSSSVQFEPLACSNREQYPLPASVQSCCGAIWNLLLLTLQVWCLCSMLPP